MITVANVSVTEAFRGLLRLRDDLECCVRSSAGDRLSDSMFDLCMKVRNELAQAMGLPQSEWHEVLPGQLLLTTSTYSDAYAALGQWITEVERRVPSVFGGSQSSSSFGFGAHPAVQGSNR
jgi:hypothetical protein